jgi:hypothetical protein
VSKKWLMEIFMRATGVMIYRLEKESLNMLMEIFLKGFFKMTKWKESE